MRNYETCPKCDEVEKSGGTITPKMSVNVPGMLAGRELFVSPDPDDINATLYKCIICGHSWRSVDGKEAG